MGKVSAEFESDEVACLTIDLNAEVVDVMISGLVGDSVVEGLNDNEELKMAVCVQNQVSACIFFQKWSIHKKRIVQGIKGVSVVNRLTDYLCVSSQVKARVLDDIMITVLVWMLSWIFTC